MPAPRIMYIENKSAQPPGQNGIQGPARIGRVSFSKTGKTLYYRGKTFMRLSGFKANYFDADTHEEYWISAQLLQATEEAEAALTSWPILSSAAFQHCA